MVRKVLKAMVVEGEMVIGDASFTSRLFTFNPRGTFSAMQNGHCVELRVTVRTCDTCDYTCDSMYLCTLEYSYGLPS